MSISTGLGSSIRTSLSNQGPALPKAAAPDARKNAKPATAPARPMSRERWTPSGKVRVQSLAKLNREVLLESRRDFVRPQSSKGRTHVQRSAFLSDHYQTPYEEQMRPKTSQPRVRTVVVKPAEPSSPEPTVDERPSTAGPVKLQGSLRDIATQMSSTDPREMLKQLERPLSRSTREDFRHMMEQEEGGGTFSVRRKLIKPVKIIPESRATSDGMSAGSFIAEKQRQEQERKIALELHAAEAARLEMKMSERAEKFRKNPDLPASLAEMPWLPPNATMVSAVVLVVLEVIDSRVSQAELQNRHLIYKHGAASLWTTTVDQMESHFGVSVGMYFRLICVSAVMLLGLFVVPGSAMLAATLAGKRVDPVLFDALGIAQTSIANIGPSELATSLARAQGDPVSFNWELWPGFAASPDVIAAVFSGIGLIVAFVTLAVTSSLIVMLQSRVLAAVPSLLEVADWSLVVFNLGGKTTELDVAEHMDRIAALDVPQPVRTCCCGASRQPHVHSDESAWPSPTKHSSVIHSGKSWLGNSWVANVELISDVSDAVAKSVRITQARKKLVMTDAKVRKFSKRSPWFDPAKLHQLEEERAQIKARIARWKGSKPAFSRRPVAAFVTFNHEESRERVLADYALSSYPCACLCQHPSLLLSSLPASQGPAQAASSLHDLVKQRQALAKPKCSCPRPVRVEPAPTPEKIRWERISQSGWKTWVGRGLLVGVLAGMIAVSLALVASSLVVFQTADMGLQASKQCFIDIPLSSFSVAPRLMEPAKFRGNSSVDPRACTSVLGPEAAYWQLQAPILASDTSIGRMSLDDSVNRSDFVEAAYSLRSGVPPGIRGPHLFTIPNVPLSVHGVQSSSAYEQSVAWNLPCVGKCWIPRADGWSAGDACVLRDRTVTMEQLHHCYCLSQTIERVAVLGPLAGLAGFFQNASSDERVTNHPLFVPSSCLVKGQMLGVAQGSTWIVSLVSVAIVCFIPMIVQPLVAGLGGCWDMSREFRWALGIQVLLQSVLTWGSVVIVSGGTGMLPTSFSTAVSIPTLRGFGPEWHAYAGTIIVQTMILLAVLPNTLAFLVSFLRMPLRRLCALRSALDQQQLEEQLKPPTADVASRLPYAMNIILTSVLFSSSFPLLPLVGSISLALLFGLEKIAFLRFLGKQERDASVQDVRCALNILSWSLPLGKLTMDAWILSDSELFPGSQLPVWNRLPFILAGEGIVMVLLIWAGQAVMPHASSRCCSRLLHLCSCRQLPSEPLAPGFWPGFRKLLPSFTGKCIVPLISSVNPVFSSGVPAELIRDGWKDAALETAQAEHGGHPAVWPDDSAPAPPRWALKHWTTDSAALGRRAFIGDQMFTWEALAETQAYMYSMGSCRKYEDAYALVLPLIRQIAKPVLREVKNIFVERRKSLTESIPERPMSGKRLRFEDEPVSEPEDLQEPERSEQEASAAPVPSEEQDSVRFVTAEAPPTLQHV
jgi:hypothetical protein